MHKQQLNEIVDFYLKNDTNYAMMITGEWGVGKTYYFKNTLKKQISETPTYDDNQKQYIPLLISLFGLKSIEEIQSEIFLSLNPYLKNRMIKLGKSIARFLVRGIMNLKTLGDYDFADEVDVDKKDWIKFGQLVICFDDLERMSEGLNLEEFIGYINTLVENGNIKVLIIANENKIEDEKYFSLKEKVIGTSIEFLADQNSSYGSLIETKFSGFPNYQKFLNSNKEFLLEVFKKNSSNLRTLSFAFLYFHKVFSDVIIRFPKESIFKEKESEILLMLLKFTLVISIEYKQGNISYNKKRDLDAENSINWSSLMLEKIDFGLDKKQKKEDEKSYREKLLERFYVNDRYYYYKSIYDFLTGGSSFRFENLVIELNDFYHIENNKILPQIEVLNQLNYPVVFSHSDAGYKKLTKEMLVYLDAGKYEMTSCPSIFYLASRFGNPLRYNLNSLEKRVIKGMLKGKSNNTYNYMLGHFLNIDSNAEHKSNLNRIRDAALKLNQQIKEEANKLDVANLEVMCFKDFEGFSAKVLDTENQYALNPIFIYFNVNKFYSFFLNAENRLRWQVILFFGNRYGEYPSSNLKSESDFLVKLSSKVEEKIRGISNRGITNFIYKELEKVLQTSIKRLHSI